MARIRSEWLVDKLLEHYESELPAKLADTNRQFQDGIELKVPVVYLAGERTMHTEKDYPHLYVLVDGGTIARYGETWTDATHEVRVRIALKDDNSGRLRRALYRYMDVLWEALVTRFFWDTPDAFFTQGEPTFEIEPLAIEAALNAPPYVMAATLSCVFNRQEDD